jgi:Mg2+-importing ATPase
VINLTGGSLVPADCLLIDSSNLYVNQSVLTGESASVEKRAGTAPIDSSLDERINCLYMGSSVFSGAATALVMRTGSHTEYGEIAEKLSLRSPETDFEKGVRQFGYLLSQIMMILTLVVFAINIFLDKPAIDSLLFSVALAVGITPQLLPAIISITLSVGARKMARNGVIIRRLNSIENFGSMDFLCTDKTGTLTQGDIQLDRAVDSNGQDSNEILRLAYLNSFLQKGMQNSLDVAIQEYQTFDTSAVTKLDELVFDFHRKRLSVLFKENDKTIVVTKGAFNSVLEISDYFLTNGKQIALTEQNKNELIERYKDWSNQGIRVLGVAQKTNVSLDRLTMADESHMTFTGFLLFSDHPKEDTASTISQLKSSGVNLCIISGDNKYIALNVAEKVGLTITGVLTGKELRSITDEALWKLIDTVNLFAEVDPNQKERIILALKKKSHIVGYMGDGINDVPALHAADVSISVDNAVDVAKEAADVVLMEKSLSVLNKGIQEGRVSFGNTLKYILVTTSANFGNMFSMAGISIILPFFPLLPKQILLLNFLTDFPALALSRDSVDEEMLKKPRKWDISFIRNFMFVFGLISSVFDFLVTFALFAVLQESGILFRSGWFIFSILTELFTLMVMRTNKPFYKSKPASILLYLSILIGIITLLIPYSPLAVLFEISPVPLMVVGILSVSIVFYVTALETGKIFFYRHFQGKAV